MWKDGVRVSMSKDGLHVPMWVDGVRVVRCGWMVCALLNADRWLLVVDVVRCGWMDGVRVKTRETLTGLIAEAPGACAFRR